MYIAGADLAFMDPVAKLFLIFFAGSIVLLLLIFCCAAPGIWRSLKRVIKQQAARRKRGERMLVDRKKLDADSLALEGIYRFDS